MSRAGTDPHSHIANGEIADAMHAGRMLDSILGNRLGDDPFAFLLHRKRLERLVLEVAYLLSVVIADQPFE